MSLFVVYTTSNVIGSTDRMWELLKEAAALHPVAGNADGSYLTMKSESKQSYGLADNQSLTGHRWWLYRSGLCRCWLRCICRLSTLPESNCRRSSQHFCWLSSRRVVLVHYSVLSCNHIWSHRSRVGTPLVFPDLSQCHERIRDLQWHGHAIRSACRYA